MDTAQTKLSKEAYAHIEAWLSQPKYAQYKDELERMITEGQWQELEDSFFKVLEFGTGGRRGKTGIGPNRINRVTIGESAQALCEYAREFDSEAPAKGIVIACDTRLSSPELSQYTAQVCAGNGFKTYIFDSFRATPELSFAVRHLGCAAGIVISASHNPPADNGFKAYWSDGAQIVPPHDTGILSKASLIEQVRAIDSFEAGVQSGEIIVVGEAVDQAYFDAVLEQTEGTERDIQIVYSPLHGAGQTNVLPALEKAGFQSVVVVEEQMVPDGNFPTVPNGKPNPEERAANELAVKKMLEVGADIAITNDPDADRIGVIVRQGDEAVYLTGNQSAALAADYALQRLVERGELSKKHYLVKTIVTTDMIDALAEKYHVSIYGNLLVGFKYVGEVIRNKENTDEVFVLGAEESYGLLKGTYARDKDGATGALPLAEYAAELKQQGKTLYDRLLELYQQVGLYVETLETTMYEGAEGFATMQRIMSSFRQDPPKTVGQWPVSATLDYQALTKVDAAGQVSQIDCAKGNVLVFELGDRRRRVTIRPSGTEPKLKLYMQWFEQTDDAEADHEKVKALLGELFEAFSAEALRRAN